MKRNLSSYFFKKNLQHYSFGQMLVAGALAVAIGSSTVGGAFAMTKLQSKPAEQTGTTPQATLAPSPTPAPTPNANYLGLEWYANTIGAPATPKPDIPVTMDLSGSVQNLSVAVYETKTDGAGNTWQDILRGVPFEVTIVCNSLTEFEHEENKTEHQASKVGAISKYDIDTKTGTFQLKDIDPGKYSVSLALGADAEDDASYILPKEEVVEVTEKIDYTPDENAEAEAGKEDDVEDGGNGGGGNATPAPPPSNTVTYVDSKTETVEIKAYWLVSGETWTENGQQYLYLKDGSKSPYYATTAVAENKETYLVKATLDTKMAEQLAVQAAGGSTDTETTADAVSVTSAVAQNANYYDLMPLSQQKASSAFLASSLNTKKTTMLVIPIDEETGAEGTPEPSADPTAEPSSEPTPSTSPSESPSPAPSESPSPSPSVSPSPSPSESPSPSPSESPSPSPSESPSPSPSTEPTPSPSPTLSPSPTPSIPVYEQKEVVLFKDGTSVASDYFKLTAPVSKVVQTIYQGWQTIDGVKYYYDPATNKPVTGTQVINGTTYEFGADGSYGNNVGEKIGIDVSYHQGAIDWNRVKAAGVEFVIIRAGYRGYETGVIREDVRFRSNIEGAKAAGLRVGIYFFSQAVNAMEGYEEASVCLNLIRQYGTNYPIYIDSELSGAPGNVGRADGISNAARTEAVVAFCETIKAGGYTPGIYASKSWFTSKLNYGAISGYSLWNAQWGSTNGMANAGMWQYTNYGAVDGVGTRVDMNISYIG